MIKDVIAIVRNLEFPEFGTSNRLRLRLSRCPFLGKAASSEPYCRIFNGPGNILLPIEICITALLAVSNDRLGARQCVRQQERLWPFIAKKRFSPALMTKYLVLAFSLIPCPSTGCQNTRPTLRRHIS